MKNDKDNYWHSFAGRKAMVSGIGIVLLGIIMVIVYYVGQ